jgi:hypothetical protein
VVSLGFFGMLSTVPDPISPLYGDTKNREELGATISVIVPRLFYFMIKVCCFY